MRTGALFWLLSFAVLVSCGRTQPFEVAPKPEQPVFRTAVPAGHTSYDNGDLADLFVRLTHDLEWGASRPNFVRYEAPVAVGLTGPGSEQYVGFVDDFLGEVRRFTNIDVARRDPPHNLVIQFVPGREFAEATTNLCIFVTGVPSWSGYVAGRGHHDRHAEVEQSLSARTVFIPDTGEPHQIRACLMEEITQALGPSNDLYALSSSIFNDDDGHVWPTRLDYLMLSVAYDPLLETGLGRRETAERARIVLDRMNPAGRAGAALPALDQQGAQRWRDRLHRVLGSGDTRSTAAVRDVERLRDEAVRNWPGSAYHCEALRVLASMRRVRREKAALSAAEDAIEVCKSVHGPEDIRLAALRLDRAVALFERREYQGTLDASEGLAVAFAAHGREELVAAALTFRARAQVLLENDAEARALFDRATRWAAYAHGADAPVVGRLRRF